MKKSIKNKILMSLVVLFTITMALVGVFNIKPNAVADATFAGQDTLIRVENSEEGGRKGIRFTSNVSKSILDEYAGYTLSYGTFIMPAHYLADEFHGEINEDSVFGENPKYIFDKSEDSSLDVATRPWKILHVSGALTEIDAETYAIKASVNMNVVNNWNIKYVAKAYIKAELEGAETEYVFADSAASQSMLDAVVVKMDDKNVQDDAEMMGILNDFIDGYEANGGNVTVNYEIVQKYAGSEEIPVLSATTRMGSLISIDGYNAPSEETAAVANRDCRYYYFDAATIASLRAKASGTTKIVIDFTAKPVYGNSDNPAVLQLNKLNETKDDNVPYADSYEVALSGEKNVTVLRSDIASLKKGATHLLKQFPEDENVVYEISVRPVTAILSTVEDLSKMPYFGHHETYTYANGEYYLIGADIDMTGYSRGWTSSTGFAGGTSYNTHGLRGVIDGDGHVLYNLTTRFIDIIGYSSELKNLTIIGNALTTNDRTAFGLISRANYGEITNCRFDITVPESVNTFAPNYDWTGIVFEHMYSYNVSGVAKTVVPRVRDTVIRVQGSNLMNSTLFGRCETGVFSNVHVFTDNANVFAEGKAPAEENAPVIYGLNDTISSTEFFSESLWSFENKIPTLNNKVLHSVKEDYSGYTLNADKNGRDANTNNVVVNINDFDYVVDSSKIASQGGVMKSYVVKNGDEFVSIVVNKVTAFINNANDLENILWLAGGANPSSVTINGTAGYHKFGAGEKFVLTNNIDMAGRTPALDSTAGSGGSWGAGGFHGTIDGNGYTVTNLTKPLFALVGSGGRIINTSFVADYVGETPFVNYTYGTIDNCYFDYTVSGAAQNVIANYAYGGMFYNNVFKITSLSTSGSKYNAMNSAYLCNNVQRWFMNNSIVITNASSWYNTEGNEGMGAKPTVLGLNDLTASHVENFIANGGNADVWTDNLTFKNFALNEDVNNIWGKYEFANGDTSARVANEDAFVKGDVIIDSATLSAVNDGGFYSAVSSDKDSYTRTLVRVATALVGSADEFAKFKTLCTHVVHNASAGYSSYNGYIVLTANINMTAGFALGGNPSSGYHYDDCAFNGVIDGNGFTVENAKSKMFYSLGGHYGATFKNFKYINSPYTIAVTMGNVTFENCEFDYKILNTDVQYTTNLVGVLATKVASNKKVVIKDTDIKIQNVTGNMYYVAEQILSGATLTYDNVNLYGQEKWVAPSLTENTSAPVQLAHTLNYYDEVRDFYYGRYIVDESLSSVVNTFDFSVNLGLNGEGGEVLTVPVSNFGYTDPVRQIGVEGGIAPNSTNKLVKGSLGNYYRINIRTVYYAIDNMFDHTYLYKVIVMQSGSTNQSIGFNVDLDFTGITKVEYGHTSSGESNGWGHKATIYGNNKTIYNLNVPMFGYIGPGAIVKDFNIVNMGESGCLTNKSSGGTYDNIKFTLDATGKSRIVLISVTNNNRGSETQSAIMQNCSAVVTGALGSFQLCASRGPHVSYTPGAVEVIDFNITMNAGTFSVGRLDVPGTWKDSTLTSGEVSNKVVSGKLNIDGTFTNNTVVETPAA